MPLIPIDFLVDALSILSEDINSLLEGSRVLKECVAPNKLPLPLLVDPSLNAHEQESAPCESCRWSRSTKYLQLLSLVQINWKIFGLFILMDPVTRPAQALTVLSSLL